MSLEKVSGTIKGSFGCMKDVVPSSMCALVEITKLLIVAASTTLTKNALLKTPLD